MATDTIERYNHTALLTLQNLRTKEKDKALSHVTSKGIGEWTAYRTALNNIDAYDRHGNGGQRQRHTYLDCTF